MGFRLLILFTYDLKVIFCLKELHEENPFYDIHTNLGAKISLFGGYHMPIQYSGVKEEHLAIRNKVGVFDVSHMGEFWVEGPNAFDLLQFVCSNDISKLIPGKAQYNYMPNDEGGVVDDLIVYQLHAEKYLLVVNASNIEKDWNHIIKQNQKFKAKLDNKSEKTALLAIQGPKAMAAMQSICNAQIDQMSYYSHTTTTFAGVKNVLVATTGYTGAGGIEIYFDVAEAEKIWKAVMEAGAHFGILPVGLAARDTLRLGDGLLSLWKRNRRPMLSHKRRTRMGLKTTYWFFECITPPKINARRNIRNTRRFSN